MMELSSFGFRALWSPWLLITTIALILTYVAAIGQYRGKWFAQSEKVSGVRIASMLTGLVMFYVAQGSPLDLLGHVMFSAHMVSMSISFLVVPPLVLYGIPDWMYRSLFRRKAVDSLVRKLTQPILTLVLFNMIFSMYHLPLVHDYVMTNYTVHVLFYIALFISSFMMWWNVVSPLPEYDRLTDVKKMGYVFANGVLLTPACALIIFAGSAMYATYSDSAVWAQAMGFCMPLGIGADFILEQFGGPNSFAWFPPRDDQQLGGVIMKLMQEITYGAILYYIFIRWYRRENPSNQIDPLKPADSLQP